jgi:hypothetical protein
MRTPMENGLASMCTPRACSMRKVSRALWPIASTTWLAAICVSPSARRRPRTRPASIATSSTRAAEADLAAQRLDLGAHGFDHGHQLEGADVRLADIEDFRRRAGLDEFGEHLAPAPARVLDLAVELAVGKGAGAALAELDVRFRIELPLRQRPQVSWVRSRTALPRSRISGEAHLRQQQAGEEAAGPGADHHRARLRRRRWRAGDETVGRCRASGRRGCRPASRASTAASSRSVTSSV